MAAMSSSTRTGAVVHAKSVLGGLHHEYSLALRISAHYTVRDEAAKIPTVSRR